MHCWGWGLLSHKQSLAGCHTLDAPSASDNQPMTSHRTAQTSGRRPSALTNQIWFLAEDWLPPKIACEKGHLETWIMLWMKYDFVIIADYFCTKTSRYEINCGLNNWKLPSNRQRTQWRCNKFQSANIVVASWATIVVQVILAKVYLCGFDHLNTLHTHTLCRFYFIINGYQNSISCNIASIPSRDYEKYHRLKQRSPIGQSSLRTAITGINPEAILKVGDHYDHPLWPGLQPGPPSQTPGGLGQRYWSVSVVTWPPKPGPDSRNDPITVKKWSDH